MQPVFCPANGQLDLTRLRLVFDGIGVSPAIVATVTTGIQALATALGTTIVNLNLTAAFASTDYALIVGTGARAAEPNRTLRVSYVGSTSGYLFSNAISTATVTHEFAHLLGLADRYYEGYQHEPKVAGSRVSVPMAPTLFAEPDYIPSSNLMSSAGANFTLTASQRQMILACQEESQNPRGVVGLFDTKQRSGSWVLPPTMALVNGFLFDGTMPIAGYSLAGSVVLIPKAGHTVGGDEPARELWQVRSRVDAQRNSAIRTVRGGKRYKGKRKAAAGPRIHNDMMKLIGVLAGA